MRLVSTRESIDRGEISLLAIVETLLAMITLVVLSVWFDSIQWLAGACAIAPLLLLRTEDSVQRGLRWNARFGELDKKWLLVLALCVGLGSLAFCIWLTRWWTLLIVLVLGGSLFGSICVPVFLVIRLGATAISVLKHPVQCLLAIPENWRRIVLATDSHTPPEFLPGDDEGPLILLDDWHQGNVIIRWFCLTAFLGLYPLTAAYRWSVKATCLIYLPLVWLVNTARYTPGSMRQSLEDYLADDIQFVRRVLAPLAMVALAFKITLLWYVNDAAVWLKENAPLWLLKMLRDWDHYIVPHQVPLWQIAPAVNGALAIGLWFYARYVLRMKERGPSERTVLIVWRTVTTVILLLSLYTIGCTVLITWKAGHLAENLSRLWSLIGKQPIP
ncbi:MAG: hypothetical protein AABP62_10375 [Planctomycetota bacterium]